MNKATATMMFKDPTSATVIEAPVSFVRVTSKSRCCAVAFRMDSE